MPMKTIRIYGLLLLLLMSMMAWGQEMSVAERNAAQGFNDTIDRLAPDFVLVSLCVADPTDQSQDWMGILGHAFLRLQCPAFGLDYCYSYESESMKGQFGKFLRGQLGMSMCAINTEQYIKDYRDWKRAVHEYRINMPADAEQRLWEQMDNHLQSEREMGVDLVKYGCTNTILKYIEDALSPDTIVYEWPEKYYTKTAIEIAEEHYDSYPWERLLLKIYHYKSLARLAAPKEKVIYTADLLDVWSNATINGEPILIYIGDLVEAEPVVVKKPWFTPQLCGILLLVLIIGVVIIVVRKRKNRK